MARSRNVDRKRKHKSQLQLIQGETVTTKNLREVKERFFTASVVSWSEFVATNTEVPGSIPGATRFSEK
jgi:hypothetical protein